VTEKQFLWATRWSILVIGLLGLITALYFQNVYQLMVKSFSILFVSLIIPMTAALYWKKANGPSSHRHRWEYPRIREEVGHPGFPFSQTKTLEGEKFSEGIK
jgi:Na+/proline symporter